VDVFGPLMHEQGASGILFGQVVVFHNIQRSLE
jgi:hypothetical protein